jgi:hypothetical protein
MSEQQEPTPAPKKKRVNKPKATKLQQMITLATTMTLEEKKALYDELNGQLIAERTKLEAALKSLESV